jgi:regulator of protease activity HflC (stomatin/prohibitin superfamily)
VGAFLQNLLVLAWEYLIPVAVVFKGQQGVRWTWGRWVKALQPGIYVYVPFIQRVETTWVCYQEVDTLIQQFTTTDGVTISASANVGYVIKDAAAWATKVYAFDSTVERAIRRIIFRACFALTYEEVRESIPALTETIFDEIQAKVDPWGVEILEVGFSDLARTKVIRLLNEQQSFVFNQAQMG